MRRYPVISGICLLFSIGIVFCALLYALGFFKGAGSPFTLGEKIGVVQIEGLIADSREISDQIEELSNDDDIQAVVLRIDSPGGGVAASQEIYQAVHKLRKKKKVVASMGSVAASGGYLIATAAERIVANPGTITGSISAVMHFPDVQELMKKVGVRSSVVKSGKFKDIGSPAREMTTEERQLIQSIVDDIYDHLVQTISENRKIPLENIRRIADGRIFSGRQALQLKLVDEMGGLQDSIQIAGRLAGITGKPDIVYVTKKKSSFIKYLMENAASVVSEELQRSSAESRGALFLLK